MFRFARPELLFLLLLIPILIVFYVVVMRRKRKAIEEFGNIALLSPLMPLLSYRRSTLKFTLLLMAILFVVVGVAGPQFGSKLQQVKKEGVEIMIALDVSNSMLAQDIQPNRLERAKMAIAQMVEKLNNDKIGLVVFAGDAYVQLPITTDYSSARMFLSGISTDIVPVQGTAIGNAIEKAANSFTPETETAKAIIVITDGENHQDDAVAAAKAVNEKGITVHTIGMGLEKGGPIPDKASLGDYIKDGQGNVVISQLDEKALKEIAAAGQGIYLRASNSAVGLSNVLDEINNMQKSLIEERLYTDYDEKYQYFLWIGLFFIILEFMVLGRRNKNLMKITLFDVDKKKGKKE